MPRTVPIIGFRPPASTFPRKRLMCTSTTLVFGSIRIPHTRSRIIARVTTRPALRERNSRSANSCVVSRSTWPERVTSRWTRMLAVPMRPLNFTAVTASREHLRCLPKRYLAKMPLQIHRILPFLQIARSLTAASSSMPFCTRRMPSDMYRHP